MNDRELWATVMPWTLIVLGIVDAIAFGLEWREHRKWTRAAKAEVIALLVLIFLGWGDWHLEHLNEEHEKHEKAAITARVDNAQGETANARKEAADARKESQAAKDESKAARDESAQLRKDVEPLLRTAKKRYPFAATDQEALAELARSVEAAKLEMREQSTAVRKELATRTDSRRVTFQQAQKITAELKAAGVGTTRFRMPGNDPEVQEFFGQLEGAVRAAGWKVGPAVRQMFDTNEPGLFLGVRDWDHVPPLCNALGLALIHAGVKIALKNSTALPDGVECEVFVSYRPLP